MGAFMTTMIVETESLTTPRRTTTPNRGKRAGDNLKSVLIGVHCTPKMVDQIERFISTLEYDEMTRPEAIRLILKRYLKEKGFE